MANGFIVMALLHGGLKHIGLCNPVNGYKTPENVLESIHVLVIVIVTNHFYEIEMLDWSKISELQALVSLHYVSTLHIPP